MSNGIGFCNPIFNAACENQEGGSIVLDVTALGRMIGPFTSTYTRRDVILYNLAVGAGFAELEYCYEKYLKVIPTFSLATTFDFFWFVARRSNINPAGILHGEQELIFNNPVPTEGAFITSGAITHYYDQGKDKGALVVGECTIADSDGVHLVTGICRLFARFDGGFGGEKAPRTVVTFPERTPDRIVADRPSENQNLLYRLTGDYFELHVDPVFARKSGFTRPIMHGACAMGYGCRAMIRELVPGYPENIKRLACRFSRPLYPGLPIETHLWKTEKGKALWRVIDAENGAIVIDNGEIDY